VYDAAVHSQTLLNGVQEIAKFVEVINNQVSQIQKLTDQLDQFKRYERLFGDPSKVVLGEVKPLTELLKKSEVGETLASLKDSVDPGEAMAYNDGGIFHSIGKDFVTPGGQKVKRQEADYLPVAALQKTTDNYLAVSEEATDRRTGLKEQIANATDQLKSAKSDAEVQKLIGVLIALSAGLESSGQEVGQATASAVVQDIANRADEKRQLQAAKEQQHAEFAEAFANYAKTFRLMTEPTKFPEK
jgi:hypothetical protein